MTIRSRVAAFAAAVGPADGLRFALTDSDAIALAAEVTPARHPEKVAAALDALEALGTAPTDLDALVEWAAQVKAARAAFWDAYEGETVDGVEIIRRRA